MIRYSLRKVDESGKIMLHSELRKNLKIMTGDKFSMQLIDTSIIMHKLERESETGLIVTEIDEIGKFALPKDFMHKLDVGIGAEIALYQADNAFILKSKQASPIVRYSSTRIDPLGRIVLSGELRENLNVGIGDKLFLQLIGTLVTVQRAEEEPGLESIICEVGDLGMVFLPNDFRQKLGDIGIGSSLAVYHTDNILILKADENCYIPIA